MVSSKSKRREKMQRDQKEQLAWELQCYGCSKAQLEHIVKTQCFPGEEIMFAAGILSDAQEVLSAEYGEPDHETARQYINRAKFIMFKVRENQKEAA
jgi:hypothetical protein